MNLTVIDIETDGLLYDSKKGPALSKIHCLSYAIVNNREVIARGTITDYEEMIRFLNVQEYIVGHNFPRFDVPALEKVLGIKIQSKVICTLAISFYLYPYRSFHGLEEIGETVGFPKPEITDWQNLPLEEYIRRCEADVEINYRFLVESFDYLMDIYQDFDKVIHLSLYLSFKMACLRDQEFIKIPVNIEKCEKHYADLEVIFDEKYKILSSAMPRELGKVLKVPPKKLTKKDGSLSSHGIKWFEYLREHNLPVDTQVHQEEPNPGSDVQLKKWLFSLGWKPITFGDSKSKKNPGKKIPKVSLPFGQGLCQSVKDLYEVEPKLEELDGYFKIKHRMGVFKSFMSEAYDGMVSASAHGFTNTLRLTHSKPIANLPKPSVFYGKEIREVLEVPDDSYIMIGSDISGLEDNTKQHYIFPYDPEYVRDMQVPGFDPHTDIGVLAGLISKEDEEFFKKIDSMEDLSSVSPDDMARYKNISKQRGTSKSTNFAATYGAGGPKIAEVAKLPLEEGFRLHKVYWDRNWAIIEIAKNCIVKSVRYKENISFKEDTGKLTEDGKPIYKTVRKDVIRTQKWLYNPLSGFWLFLKNDKDRFSTLNQNTGNFVFDSWVNIIRQKLNPLGIYICLQYHDELLIYCKKEFRNLVSKVLRESMEEVNKLLNLNVTIRISIDYGTSYDQCH